MLVWIALESYKGGVPDIHIFYSSEEYQEFMKNKMIEYKVDKSDKDRFNIFEYPEGRFNSFHDGLNGSYVELVKKEIKIG